MSNLRSHFAVLTMALFMAQTAPAHAEGRDKSVIGKWKLTAVLDSSEISALDNAQAQKLVGQVLSIGADRVQLGKEVCEAPSFEATRAETDEYLYRHARATGDNLGLPNPVNVVNVGCMDVYQKPPKLVVHWQGVFFEAVRQRQR